ncbi:MAG: FumA C-terminus/TtdB family hydratase beta subunit [Kiritimatiellia bacterium]
MAEQILTTPLTEEAIRSLRAGETVLLSGILHTGRDRFHKHLGEGGSCPFSLRNGAIFHCGPVVRKEAEGWRIVSAGPTTSCREEPYMADIIARHGVRAILGKGGMGVRTIEACRRYGCVYLQVVGGAAALLAECIRAVRDVSFLDEFGATEASWTIEVEALPALVGIDAHGSSLFADVEKTSRAELDSLLSFA